jgi:hypothetical protein
MVFSKLVILPQTTIVVVLSNYYNGAHFHEKEKNIILVGHLAGLHLDVEGVVAVVEVGLDVHEWACCQCHKTDFLRRQNKLGRLSSGLV